jgi:hypothetical protein
MDTLLCETTEDVIASFMQQVIIEYQGFGEAYRRKEPREMVSIPVCVHPLDDDLQPAGEAFQGVTRDISYGGVGIFHIHPLQAAHVLVEIFAPDSKSRMKLLAKVEHCTRFGGFYLIGCRFAGVAQE